MAGVQSSNSSFSLRGGFWMYQSLAPTAAGTSISGRIITPDGHGIRNARLVLTRLSNGEIHTALSASFGFYRFDDLPVGETYLLHISAKRYTFDSDTRIIHLLDELTDFDFIAGPAQ
jgi:hypothetical protein